MTKYMNRTNDPKITWNQIIGATAYEITLDEGLNTTEVITNEFKLSDFGFDINTSTDDGAYTFKVRTKKGEEVSNFSEGFDFTLDTVLLNKVSEDFPNLDTQGASFTGTMTFDENVVSVSSISFVDAFSGSVSGGTISVSGGIGTNTLTISGTAPNEEDIRIKITVVDLAGNSREITSEAYHLPE